MKIAELLRKLADIVDSPEEPQATATSLTPVAVGNEDDTESSVMVAPLQAKIELMKKSEGVPNVYDGDKDLDILKRNAGLAGAVKQDMADDEPTE